MESKDFLDYLKKIPEERAIAIIDDMNLQADRMADIINNKSNRAETVVMPKIAEINKKNTMGMWELHREVYGCPICGCDEVTESSSYCSNCGIKIEFTD